ncbi:MAG TPA: hypothetical protein VFS43_38390 [Polyangiaceae bacterium]|nr:hypothetical protein [Polyangiaceae bacterium]
MALTFDGRGATLAVLNATTGDEKLSGMKANKFSFSIKTTKVAKAYLGDVGSDVTVFYDGYELTLDYDPNSVVALVDFTQLVLAKLRGEVQDEFVSRFRLESPDAGAFQVLFKNMQWEEPSFDQGGQQEIFTSSLKASGKEIQFKRA